MNNLKKLALSLTATALVAEQSFAAINAGLGKVNQDIAGNNESADVAIMKYVSSAMAFLAIIGVLYGLYGGFLMLTAGGDEEKVKKGKTIIVQIGLGLLVIALAYSIVKLAVGFLFGGTV